MRNLGTLASFVLALGLAVSAARAGVIDTVLVDDPGNEPDTRFSLPGYGSVSYSYRIGKYEVTAGEYTEFLNAVAGTDTHGLYNPGMSDMSFGSGITRGGSSGHFTYSVHADFVNRPVNYVSYWDACRFANWLHNGRPMGTQGSGTTETGAYELNGYNHVDGRTIQRSTDARWAVTSEDEWYKAAYYKGGSQAAGYWSYPTRSDTAPGQDLNDLSGNNANYSGPIYPIQPPHFTTAVGEFEYSEGPYGAYDQGGNVWEWTEAIGFQEASAALRVWRGGSFLFSDLALHASVRHFYYDSTVEVADIGFRISEVPEPGSLALAALVGMAVIHRRRRHGSRPPIARTGYGC